MPVLLEEDSEVARPVDNAGSSKYYIEGEEVMKSEPYTDIDVVKSNGDPCDEVPKVDENKLSKLIKEQLEGYENRDHVMIACSTFIAGLTLGLERKKQLKQLSKNVFQENAVLFSDFSAGAGASNKLENGSNIDNFQESFSKSKAVQTKKLVVDSKLFQQENNPFPSPLACATAAYACLLSTLFLQSFASDTLQFMYLLGYMFLACSSYGAIGNPYEGCCLLLVLFKALLWRGPIRLSFNGLTQARLYSFILLVAFAPGFFMILRSLLLAQRFTYFIFISLVLNFICFISFKLGLSISPLWVVPNVNKQSKKETTNIEDHASEKSSKSYHSTSRIVAKETFETPLNSSSSDDSQAISSDTSELEHADKLSAKKNLSLPQSVSEYGFDVGEIEKLKLPEVRKDQSACIKPIEDHNESVEEFKNERVSDADPISEKTAIQDYHLNETNTSESIAKPSEDSIKNGNKPMQEERCEERNIALLSKSKGEAKAGKESEEGLEAASQDPEGLNKVASEEIMKGRKEHVEPEKNESGEQSAVHEGGIAHEPSQTSLRKFFKQPDHLRSVVKQRTGSYSLLDTGDED